MNVVKHKKPQLQLPEFECDKPLHPKLENDPLLRNMNLSFLCLFLGPPRSGKTSLLTSLLMTKSGKKQKCKASFNKVFNQIHVFMPKTSQGSMKNSPFADIPEDQLHESLTVENLHHVHEVCKLNKEENKTTLLILDDVQSDLKNKEVEIMLLHIIANRRHLNCSLMIVAQNYNKISKNVRILASDSFIFNPSPPELDKITEEIVDADKTRFLTVVSYFRKIRAKTKHTFLYIHDKSKYFVNWNEIVFDDDNEE